MKNLLLLVAMVILTSLPVRAAMTKESCATKIKAAILAGTGQEPANPNLIEYLCEGIIQEIQQNAVVETTGSQTAQTGTVQ